TFQSNAGIDDRTITLSTIERFAERLRRCCSIVEQSHLSKIYVPRQSESEQWIFQCFGRQLKESDLTRNTNAHIFLVYLTDRQTRPLQQRLKNAAGLAQILSGQARRHAQRVRLGSKVSLLGRLRGLSSRAIGNWTRHRNESS